jgi:hypothetical protein
MTTFFVVDSVRNAILGTYDSRDAAAGHCQDAAREDGDEDAEDRYEVQESGEIEVVVVGPSLGDVSDEDYEAECNRLEQHYTNLEGDTRYSVSVRPARGGEASGTYYRRASGDLQILGYSLEVPEDLSDLSEAAWQNYCA